MDKILTVSVAAYNVESYIEKCLTPFCNDDVQNRIEVLIIDDGATDNTALKASEYESSYPNTFKVIHKENGGWGSTVNVAIEKATGKYFKQLDGDDYYDADNLTVFLDALEKTEADLVLTPFIHFVSGTGEIIKKEDPIEQFKATPYIDYPISDIRQEVNIAMHQCTFRTSVLKQNDIRLLEHAFYTDVELVTKSVYYSKTVCFLPVTVYCYRTSRTGQSMSLDGVRKHYKEHEKVVLEIADFLHNNEITSGLKLSSKRLSEMIYYQYKFYIHLLPTNIHKEELIFFDENLKNHYPEFYGTTSKMVKALRISSFFLYRPICWFKRKEPIL